jgi:membrane-bound lytic murein transglycosylase D
MNPSPQHTTPTPARPTASLGFFTLAVCLLLGACAATPKPDAIAARTRPQPTVQPPVQPVAPATSAALRPPVPLSNQPLSSITTDERSLPGVVMLSAPVDVWDRIRRGFAMPNLEGDLVRDREQWYATRPDYIQRMTERSGRYLFHIVEEIERRNLPMELALLPFIESAFNPQAVSSARAAGMWQFMPATGESFDLKQNVFRDDRRDVLASTRAALDYLEQLHARFGDWHLALAAYNWGQGNVNRAITNNQRMGLPTGYTDLTMPAETRLYVPKLQAVENIMARPEAYNAQLPQIGNHPFFDTISIDRDIDVALIASLADVSEKDFRALNPSIKQPVVMAAGTPNILLPWDNAGTFQSRLASHKGPLASWTAWVVPTTMTAAQAAERSGMSEGELREVNNIPPRMLVRAGSGLLVRRSAMRNSDVSEFVADNAQLSLQPEIILRATTVRARKGDNLAKLAARYNVSPVSAAGWNRLAVNAQLKKGQRLTLMLPKSVRLASAPAAKRKLSKAEARVQAREAKASGKSSAKVAKAGKAKKVASAPRAKGGKSGKAGKTASKASTKVADAGKGGKKSNRN